MNPAYTSRVSSAPPSLVGQTVLVFAKDVAAAAQFFPHLRHFLSERRVLALQEGGAHRYLVLLETASVPGALGRFVVLVPPGPVLLVLQEEEEEGRLVILAPEGDVSAANSNLNLKKRLVESNFHFAGENVGVWL